MPSAPVRVMRIIMDYAPVVYAAGSSCVTEVESAFLAHERTDHIPDLRWNCCAGF